MTVDYIRYDILTQDALRGVVRAVLTDVAAKGLPGEHHFFILFDTQAEDVRLSPRLKSQYPKEMTIVLQHQFWDLVVTNQGFEVGLSFNGVPERLVVPFLAIKSFVDPSVQFGLQFATIGEAEDAAETASDTSVRPPAKHDRTPQSAEPLPVPANPAAIAAKPDDEPPESGGEVVRLDRFRKK